MNVTVNGKKVSLNQSDYKGAGGEGTIYVKSGNAYKIYHDAAKMIPTGKIQELAQLNLSNVLGPTDVIYQNNIPVGFVMKFVSDTEFLCKLFTKGFRDKNNVTPTAINVLVKGMQETLKKIHDKKVLVVDYNEMNFLVNNNFDTVYHIDVDSYQTASYPATAIMESIRDRKVKSGKFTEESDWFSFGVVAFQLYMGCHPFKGRHPDYAPKDWMKMMDAGISVFNRKCMLPPACQTFDVIPKGHLKWFEAIFEKGERVAPPEPDYVPVVTGPVQTKLISSSDKFNVSLYRDYGSQVVAVRFIDGICYVLSRNGLHADAKQLVTLIPESGYTAKRAIRDIVPVHGGQPVILTLDKLQQKLTAHDITGNQVGTIESKGFFVANRCAYTVVRDGLIEISFRNTGIKVTALQQIVANIFHNHQVFDGLVSQTMLGTCRFAIPFQTGKCGMYHMKELDSYRVVDAKYDSGICIVLAESAGKYDRFTFVFDKQYQSYTTRVEKDVALEDINFAVKDNGVCIASNGDKLELFVDNTKVKIVDSPLSNNEDIIVFKNDAYVVNYDSMYKVSSK